MHVFILLFQQFVFFFFKKLTQTESWQGVYVSKLHKLFSVLLDARLAALKMSFCAAAGQVAYIKTDPFCVFCDLQTFVYRRGFVNVWIV